MPAEAKKRPKALGELVGYPHEISDALWLVRELWPIAPGPDIPDLIPPDVARVYVQAERNFAIKGNEEAAGTMYRKALDIALKTIDPDLKGMLGPRITKLAAAGKLTKDIEEWSNSIKEAGNDAVHESDPITRDQLIDLRNFCEMVLRYLFTLPNMIKRRRGEKLDWEEMSTPKA